MQTEARRYYNRIYNRIVGNGDGPDQMGLLTQASVAIDGSEFKSSQ